MTMRAINGGFSVIRALNTGAVRLRAISNPVARYKVVAGAGGGGGSSSVAALDDLTDVIITSPTLGDTLYYNGSGWVNTQGFANQSVAIASGVSTGTVTFPTAQANDSWKLDALYVENDTDASPLSIVVSIGSKTTTGFTYLLNGNTDSANYVLVYRLAGIGGTSSTQDSFARMLAIAALAMGRR